MENTDTKSRDFYLRFPPVIWQYIEAEKKKRELEVGSLTYSRVIFDIILEHREVNDEINGV